ncbi:cupin domain-containing protein [Rhodococcus marinonascens]|uniref:cupin domain-containing protein n=1 Tax=Rhodococcus marinonascens TaxID=38311 RepID=UPI0009353165|nr:cupin domain-containing protein [Rhodococcus marinonascens]
MTDQPTPTSVTDDCDHSDGLAARMWCHHDLRTFVETDPARPRSHRALVAEGARVVIFAFDADQELREHSAAFPILLQALSGHLRVTADDQTIDLRPGGLVHMTTRLRHAVTALEPSTLMLTMLDPGAR